MKYLNGLFLIGFMLLLTACSRHPVSGVWKTTDDNEYGLTKIIVSFNGRAEFVTPKLDNAIWHCFWGATDKNMANLGCTPSTNPDEEQQFVLMINDQGYAEFSSQSKLISTLTLQDENPILPE